MKTPSQIKYQGRMYRLAADVAPDTIFETAGNPLETAATPAEPAAPATEPAAEAAPVDEADKAKLESYKSDVIDNAKALSDGLGTFMDTLTDRDASDEILASTKAHLDRLVDSFKILSIAYSGYVKRNPVK